MHTCGSACFCADQWQLQLPRWQVRHGAYRLWEKYPTVHRLVSSVTRSPAAYWLRSPSGPQPQHRTAASEQQQQPQQNSCCAAAAVPCRRRPSSTLPALTSTMLSLSPLTGLRCTRSVPCSPKGWFCPGGDFAAIGSPNRTQCPDYMTTVGKRSLSNRACGEQLLQEARIVSTIAGLPLFSDSSRCLMRVLPIQIRASWYRQSSTY